ncbi:MAG: NOB1 family endonuclease, partial [Candidatus Hodarchaeales archaeon]
ITDDYEIQNTASQLNISYRSIRTQGIKRKIKWQKRCQACGELLDNPKDKECPECGSKLVHLRRR